MNIFSSLFLLFPSKFLLSSSCLVCLSEFTCYCSFHITNIYVNQHRNWLSNFPEFKMFNFCPFFFNQLPFSLQEFAHCVMAGDVETVKKMLCLAQKLKLNINFRNMVSLSLLSILVIYKLHSECYNEKLRFLSVSVKNMLCLYQHYLTRTWFILDEEIGLIISDFC